MSDPAPTVVKRVPALDGLRGLAASLIVMHHGATPFQAGLTPVLRFVADFSWVGVELFFALSGFLITGVLLEGYSYADRVRRFYLSRALRIFPLYYLILLLLTVGVVWTHKYQYLKDLLTSAAYVQNFFYGFHPAQYFWPLDPYWSLAVEEQFYLLWPLILWKAGIKRLPMLCLVGFALSLALRCICTLKGLPPSATYALTPLRLDGFLIGGCMRYLADSNPDLARRWLLAVGGVGLAAVLLAMGITGTPDAETVPMLTVGLAGYSAVFAVVVGMLWLMPENPLARLMCMPALRRTGKYSYCIYCVHFLLHGVLAGTGFGERLNRSLGPNLAYLVYTVVLFAISFGVAAVSWRYFEGPILGLKSRLLSPGYLQSGASHGGKS